MHSSTSSFRRNLIVSVGATLVACAIFVTATEMLVRARVMPRHNLYKYIDLFKSSPVESAIFGDSHFAYGLTGLTNFVNVAYQGNNFASIAEKVHLYFHRRQPVRVILQAGVHHFSHDFLTWKERKRDSFEELLKGYPVGYPLMLTPEHRKEVFKYWQIYLSGREFTPADNFMPDGSRLNNRDYSQVPETVRLAAAQRTALILQPAPGFRRSETAELYGQTVDFLKAKGATVCLLTLPVFSLLRHEIKDDRQYAEAIAYFEQLAGSRGLRYVNLLLRDLPDDDFSDPHHLNAKGARRVSAMVEQACFA
jgi:hypothetical protein